MGLVETATMSPCQKEDIVQGTPEEVDRAEEVRARVLGYLEQFCATMRDQRALYGGADPAKDAADRQWAHATRDLVLLQEDAAWWLRQKGNEWSIIKDIEKKARAKERAASLKVEAGQGLACPYCGVVLTPAPKRSRKCPECKAPIVVRTGGTGLRLITEEQAKVEGEEAKKQATRNRAVRWAEAVGYDRAAFEAREREMLASGQNWSPADVAWDLMNKAAVRAMKGEGGHLGGIYHSQARFLFEEGRPHLAPFQEWSRCELRGYRESGIEKVEVLGTDDSCPACKANSGRVFTVEEALKALPIPNPNCAADDKWCRCCWIAVIE